MEAKTFKCNVQDGILIKTGYELINLCSELMVFKKVFAQSCKKGDCGRQH